LGVYRTGLMHEKRRFAVLVATPVMFAIGMAFVCASGRWLALLLARNPGRRALWLDAPRSANMSGDEAGLRFIASVPVLLMLAKVGIAGPARKRRYAIVGSSSWRRGTPPDALSMMSLAVPMLRSRDLHLIARLVEKKRAEAEASENEPGTDVKRPGQL
jgi:Sec-independent protein secretion pathway component TatC